VVFKRKINAKSINLIIEFIWFIFTNIKTNKAFHLLYLLKTIKMKPIVIIITLLISSFGISQTNKELIKEIEKVQHELNEEYSNPETSILDSLDQLAFMGLKFYPIDLKFRVAAKFVRTPDEKPSFMKTSTERLPEYVKYGEAHFTIDEKDLVLSIFQSTNHENEEGYEDYLFLPYTDYTSGDGSYGGGKYLDFKIPEGGTIVIDFNKAYNPYCAYSHRYSCPIPPEENDLNLRIEAGVKAYK